ncbi:MAG: methylhydantoinase [Desulfotomaculum sp.]|nr:methylhydantoinase [Desulfotomaculum sp.]
MNFAISLSVEDNKISGILALGDVICGQVNRNIGPDFYTAFNEVLSMLLLNCSISSKHINMILVTVDFPQLYEEGILPQFKVGYIRYLPKIINNIPPLSKSPLRKLIFSETVTGERNFKNTLKNFIGHDVAALAVNPSFFSWLKVSESKLSNITKEILGMKVLFGIGTTFNKIGYTTRENLLLINTLLLPGVQSFYDQLKKAILNNNITAKILTLGNNGMLFSETKSRKLPIYTAGSLFSAKLVAAAKKGPSDSILLITQKSENVYMGIAKNCFPVLSNAPLQYQNTMLKLSHPISRLLTFSASIDEASLMEKLTAILRTMNPAEECKPVILTRINQDLKYFIYRAAQRTMMQVSEMDIPTSLGALMAPVCIVQEHFVTNYTGKKRNSIKNNLWCNLRAEAQREGISPNSEWRSFYEEKSIRYHPDQGSLIKLGMYGPRMQIE